MRVLLLLLAHPTLWPACVWSDVKQGRRAWSRRRIPEWRDGRYHHHVSGLRLHDPKYQAMLQGQEAWAQPSEMEVHCPAFNASLLPSELWGLRLFVAMNLRDNEGVMANAITQLRLLASLLPQPQQLFVSVFESNSHDDTPQWVVEMGRELSSLGVAHRLVSGEAAGVGAGRRQGWEDRIDFLARMRNMALSPLLEQEEQRFDRVVFINDVFFCAYQVGWGGGQAR